MDKILLKAYAKCNLGDDLFIKIITDRYKNSFYLISNCNYFKINNLKVYKRNFFKKVFDRIILKMFNIYNFYEFLIEKKFKHSVIIGGSLFVENPNSRSNDMYLNSFTRVKNRKNIIGINFGPYLTEKYKKEVANIFKSCEDVCFRDTKSYELFSDLSNTRVASDLIYSLNVSKYKKIPIDKSVLFSIIDCNDKSRKKSLEKYCTLYENKIVEMIEYFFNNGYAINLMSFCEFEGDEKAINRIEKKCIDRNLIVNKYFYRGNIEEALMFIAKNEIVVGSRFHANVLGLAMNKKIIPISYNEKTDNMLNDIKYEGMRFKIQNIDSLDVSILLNEISCLKYDIESCRTDSIRHFEYLDKVLERVDECE